MHKPREDLFSQSKLLISVCMPKQRDIVVIQIDTEWAPTGRGISLLEKRTYLNTFACGAATQTDRLSLC